MIELKTIFSYLIDDRLLFKGRNSIVLAFLTHF
jgi:hypothetical protein